MGTEFPLKNKCGNPTVPTEISHYVSLPGMALLISGSTCGMVTYCCCGCWVKTTTGWPEPTTTYDKHHQLSLKSGPAHKEKPGAARVGDNLWLGLVLGLGIVRLKLMLIGLGIWLGLVPACNWPGQGRGKGRILSQTHNTPRETIPLTTHPMSTPYINFFNNNDDDIKQSFHSMHFLYSEFYSRLFEVVQNVGD